MRIKFLAILLMITAVMLVDHFAYAGCENLCTLSTEPVAIEPPLPCVDVEIVKDECDCGVEIKLYQNCTSSVEALDFTFNDCLAPSDHCTNVVPPQGYAYTIIQYRRSDGAGQRENTLNIRNEGTDHAIKIVADIKSFDDSNHIGCGGLEGHPNSRLPPILELIAFTIIVFHFKPFVLRRFT
jgi:hypothetical protein